MGIKILSRRHFDVFDAIGDTLNLRTVILHVTTIQARCDISHSAFYPFLTIFFDRPCDF